MGDIIMTGHFYLRSMEPSQKDELVKYFDVHSMKAMIHPGKQLNLAA